MSPSWYNDISLWFSKYGFDEQVMISLFNYCYDHSALHRNYIQTVADAWYKNNIKTFNDLDLYFEKQEKLNLVKKEIVKKLRLSRALTQFEEAYISKWLVDFGYSLEIIEIALKKTTSKSNPNFDYIDKLISDWHEKNLKTPNDIQNYLENMKQKTKDIKDMEKKTKYTQRTFDNLESLYDN